MIAIAMRQVDSVRSAPTVGQSVGLYLGGLGIGMLLVWVYLLIGFSG